MSTHRGQSTRKKQRPVENGEWLVLGTQQGKYLRVRKHRYIQRQIILSKGHRSQPNWNTGASRITVIIEYKALNKQKLGVQRKNLDPFLTSYSKLIQTDARVKYEVKL